MSLIVEKIRKNDAFDSQRSAVLPRSANSRAAVFKIRSRLISDGRAIQVFILTLRARPISPKRK
jgi:hypothetical protein